MLMRLCRRPKDLKHKAKKNPRRLGADIHVQKTAFIKYILFAISFCCSLTAAAEYRVFLLRIMEKATAQASNSEGSPSSATLNEQTQTLANPDPKNNPPSTTTDRATPIAAPDILVREFPSTLDPLQYPTYYPIKENQYVVYVDTWRCKGRTNNKPLCPNPRAVSSTNESAPTTNESAPPTPPPNETDSTNGEIPPAS